MDIQAEKLNLIKWLTEVTEPSVIKRFLALKNNETSDWWDEIDADERTEIEQGLAEADRGELVPHKDVMAKYQKWLSK